MKTVARYLDNENNDFDGSYVSTLIKPNQVFVNGVIAYDPAEARADGLIPLGPKVTNFTLVDGSTTDSVIGAIITFSNVDVWTIYLLFSSTQTTPPTPTEIKANGIAFPGNTVTFTLGNLVPDRVYYGWLLAEDFDGNESDITPSVPPSFQTGRYIDFIHDGIILDPRVTFTRASTGTRVNEAGLIEVVQNDIPRVDHDPVTLQQKGLLIEEARTNTLLKSSDLLETSWLKSGITIATSINLPIFATGGSSYLITCNGSAIGKFIQRPFSTSTTTRTFSCFLRRDTHNFAQFAFYFEPNVWANFDLLTGVVGTRGTSTITATMQPWKDGWYRCTITHASPTASTFSINIVTSATSPRFESNTLATSIYVAGPQMEEGSFATSYIPTDFTAVTRAGDFASITGSNFSSWYNPLEGTFGVEFRTIFTTDSIIRYIITGNQNQLMYLAANNGTIASFDGQAPTLFGSITASGMLAKAYLGYSSTGRSLTARGANATFSSTALNFATMTSLQIGYLDTQLVPFCGWLRSLVYYPTRLSAAEIKTLST